LDKIETNTLAQVSVIHWQMCGFTNTLGRCASDYKVHHQFLRKLNNFNCTLVQKVRYVHPWAILLQPLRWRCVDCGIHHERDVREEQQYICVGRVSNNK